MSSRCVIGTVATRSAGEAATIHCSRRKQDVLTPAPHRTVSAEKCCRFSRHVQGTMVYSLMPVLLRNKRNGVSILMTRAVADMFEFVQVGRSVISVRPFPAMCSGQHTVEIEFFLLALRCVRTGRCSTNGLYADVFARPSGNTPNMS